MSKPLKVMLISPDDLPIICTALESTIKKGHFLIKSRLEFSSDDDDVVLTGSAFNSDLELALIKAKSEIIERFYCHKLVISEEHFTAFKYGNTSPDHIVLSRDDVLLGGHLDATGLAFHKNQFAQKHAVQEIVERHWLSKIWYKQESLRLINAEVYPSHTIMTLTPFEYKVNFALCVVVDTKSGAILCGSAIRDYMDDSIMHAGNEAIMLYEGYLELLSISDVQCYSRSQKRLMELATLKDDSQIHYLKSLIVSSNANWAGFQSMEIEQTINNSGLNHEDFHIVILFKDSVNCAVRAINSNALSLIKMRKSNNMTIHDPFY